VTQDSKQIRQPFFVLHQESGRMHRVQSKVGRPKMWLEVWQLTTRSMSAQMFHQLAKSLMIMPFNLLPISDMHI
jgi:hypothetical protein